MKRDCLFQQLPLCYRTIPSGDYRDLRKLVDVTLFTRLQVTFHIGLYWIVIESLAAAIAFYTCLPIPATWNLEFRYVARLAPIVGLIIGVLLILEDWGLMTAGMPPWTRSALVVATWLALTGGLHMDGAMDTADGLAVTTPERRLQVMSDSYTGAFGAMVAVVILGLKVTALSEINVAARPMAILTATMWGRWSQQVAIASYPYLKPTGKGAFHKAALPSRWLVMISGMGCLALGVGYWMWGIGDIASWELRQWGLLGGTLMGAIGVAIATGAWLNATLGGHTGDTYGACVEWTEAGILVLLTLLW